MKQALFVALSLCMLGLGCECGHPETETHTSETEGEGTPEGEGEAEGEGEPEAAAVLPTGPLGWTAIIEGEAPAAEAPAEGEAEGEAEAEETYREHRLLLWRTGPATGERPSTMAELGHFSSWQGLFTLYVASEEPGEDRLVTVFGIRGTCEATATRLLHLRVTFAPHRGEAEERLYDALELEGCAGAYLFGASGPIIYEELSTRTMTTPPEAIAAVVHDREQAITDDVGDEPMRLVARELPEFDAWVLSGWETYLVRGTEVIAHSESGIVASVTIGTRSVLLVRGEDGPVLMVPGEDDLEPVDVDADPTAAAPTAAAPSTTPPHPTSTP